MPSYAFPARHRVLLLMAALALVTTACSPSRKTLKREYRMQVTVGPATHWGMGAAKFAALAHEKTQGRVTVKPYYGSQLLKGAQLNSAQMVASGAVDLALESTINVAPVIPEMNVFNLPFFLDGYGDLDRLETGRTGVLLFGRLRAKGLEPLAWGENGFRQLTNGKRAIHTPSDVAGLKIRVVGSPIFIDIFRALGADPINMNWGDAVAGFQQGTVDGQENPMGILLAVGIQQYHRYLTRWNYLADPLILYWNKREWEAMPPDIQSALREAAAEACAYQKALARAGLDGDASLDSLKSRFGYEPPVRQPVDHLRRAGMTISELTPAEREAFAKATRSVSDKWKDRLGAEIVEAAEADRTSTP